MTNPALDINVIREKILAGEKIDPEILRQKIAEICAERFEKAVTKTAKRKATGNMSAAEAEAALSIFDNLKG